MQLLAILLLVMAAIQLCVTQRRFFPAGLAIGAGIALKSAGIGYIVGRASRNRHHRHHCCWGRRWRRDLSAKAGPAGPLSGPAVPLMEAQLEAVQMDAYFRLVSAEDRAGCGLRLVCELSAARPNSLQADEKLILAPFGVDGPTSATVGSPKHAYDVAHQLGAAGLGGQRCADAFPSCPVGVDVIMAELRRLGQ